MAIIDQIRNPQPQNIPNQGEDLADNDPTQDQSLTEGERADNAQDSGNTQPPADPQEQRQYDLMVSNAMEFINGEKTRDKVLRMLSQGPPAQAIASVVAAIGAMLKKTADMAGKTISQDAMLAAAAEVISQLIELGQAAGIFKFSAQQEVDGTARKALMIATQQFGQGLLNTQEGQAMRPEAQATVQQKIEQEQAGPAKRPVAGLIDPLHQSSPAGGTL
jgi:hypothetical protein